MSLSFHVATREKHAEICQLYHSVIADMRRRGLTQWEWGVYPTAELLEQDIDQGILYQMEEGGRMIGAFVVSPKQEEVYAQLSWHFGLKPATLHRLALRPDCFGLGLAQRVMVFVKEEAERLGYDCLRLDTSSENQRALKLFRGAMTRQAGTVHFDDPSVPFYCFESPLSDRCPLLPMRMHPAYRHGEMTPWGGDGLERVFGKDIPDQRTGEALEISAIAGLESRDDAGDRLGKLIARYGRALVGQSKEFPLLLKLIAAKDKLSVQVHPDDAYAKEHEGKLGKSEAWVILDAQAGASILYGIRHGVDTRFIQAALDAGEDIEPFLERVEVRPGDVFYIPSGMAHAIGGGIVLYEIQQSSDVTYRLWDYMRVNEKGEQRELHVKQAMDVLRPRLLGERTALPPAGEGGMHRLLSVPAFTLDSACVKGEMALPPHPESFRMVTALHGLTIAWEGAQIGLKAGESALLPALCPPVLLRGAGQALIAAVR